MKLSDDLFNSEPKDLVEYLVLVGIIIGVMCLILLALAGEIWIAQLIWNVCIVAIFPVAPISYWQMWGVYLIARFLFCSIQYSSSNNK